MAKEIKYTRDGKKVVIVDKINLNESVVREIHIVDGKEVPKGDKFVVLNSNMKEAKFLTWREDDLMKLEVQYTARKKFYEDELFKLRKTKDLEVEKMRSLVEYLKKMTLKVKCESLDILFKFLSGDIKYIVLDYFYPEIIKFEDLKCDGNPGMLPLITLFGSDDGSLNFYLNQYRDGSGYTKKIIACETLTEAVQVLEKVVNKQNSFNDNHLKLALKYDIKLDPMKVKLCNEARIKSLLDGKKNLLKNLENTNEELLKMGEKIEN